MKDIKYKAWHKIESRLFDVYGFDKDNVYEDSMNDYLETIISRKYCDLLQFTGLQDVTGKDIYEGYIYEYDNDLYVVKYSDENACFMAALIDSDCIYSLDKTKIKIIGNIYENPDLLK